MAKALVLLALFVAHQTLAAPPSELDDSFDATQSIYNARLQKAMSNPEEFESNVVEQRQLSEAGARLAAAQAAMETAARNAEVEKASVDELHIAVPQVPSLCPPRALCATLA